MHLSFAHCVLQVEGMPVLDGVPDLAAKRCEALKVHGETNGRFMYGELFVGVDGLLTALALILVRAT